MKTNYFFRLSVVLSFLIPLTSNAQYAPAAGQTGSTAIHKDSSDIKGWATTCVIERGFINIEDESQTYTQGEITSNRAFFGNETFALGPAGGSMDMVSLGDGGIAVLTFENPLRNGEGPDFAVFENGFKAQSPPYQYFLELAFVDVSSNGIDYIRFPSVSLTQTETQVGGFDQLNPENIHNLAGKYEINYGTPFDLEELKDSSKINVDSICYLRIVDVVGDLNSEFATYDSQGNKINDPWNTPFWNCGFDLDAVAVIHYNDISVVNEITSENSLVTVYPNPINSGEFLHIKFNNKTVSEKKIRIFNVSGKLIYQTKATQHTIAVNSSGFTEQLYILQLETEKNIITKKIIIRQ